MQQRAEDQNLELTELNWQTSRHCGESTHCIEVAFTNNGALVRDTKQQGKGPILSFTKDEWHAFTAGVKDGEFDLND